MNSFIIYLKSSSPLFLGGMYRWILFLAPPIGFLGPFKLNTSGFIQVALLETYFLIGWFICYLISNLNFDVKDIKGDRMFITDFLFVFIVGGLAAIMGILFFDKIGL